LACEPPLNLSTPLVELSASKISNLKDGISGCRTCGLCTVLRIPAVSKPTNNHSALHHFPNRSPSDEPHCPLSTSHIERTPHVSLLEAAETMKRDVPTVGVGSFPNAPKMWSLGQMPPQWGGFGGRHRHPRRFDSGWLHGPCIAAVPTPRSAVRPRCTVCLSIPEIPCPQLRYLRHNPIVSLSIAIVFS